MKDKAQPWKQMTPAQCAELLRASGMAEDDVVDMLYLVAQKYGWTVEINEVGLHYLKPQAHEGEEKAA